jgi:glucuronoarabinoxylan endo-1,4-beta-xylanase
MKRIYAILLFNLFFAGPASVHAEDNEAQNIFVDAVASGGGVVLSTPAASVTGVINAGVTYQTMDGFGGGITWGNNILHANSQRNAIYDLLFTDLGLDLVRIRNVYGRMDYSTMSDDQKTYMAAKTRNGAIKFLMMSASPPANLKDNGSVLGSGSNATLKYVNGSFVYNDFATYWRSAFNSYASLGLTLDYSSVQNEPDYDTPLWETCRLRQREEVYNGKLIAGYNTCLDKVYEQLSSSTKFVGPEATGVGFNKVQDFVDTLDQSKLSVIAYHLYNGGDTANPDSYSANMQAIAAKYPAKTIWQTEFDQVSPFKTAWLMHNCIVDGRASAYFHWKAIWMAPDTRALIAVNSGSGYSVNKYYYYFKQFSKFISAGYKRIAASSGLSSVKMSAYMNPAGTQMTVVLINTGSSAASMSLDFSGLSISSSAIYRTSSSENFVSAGPLGSGNTVTLPAQSVSTAVLTVSASQYTITATAGSGGSISPSGTVTVATGSSQSFTITPSSGNEIAGVLVDGASVGAVATYTFSSVIANHTISATFSPFTRYQINCGGGASSPYTQDQYFSGGTARTVTSSITTAGVTNPAPQAVYRAERYGTSTYTFPNLTAGASYQVRLHFAELYWTASGKRRFNVTINGATVLSNFDIYAATGARYKAVVREFIATAGSSGQIVIRFTTVTDNATIEGIQIIRQ